VKTSLDYLTEACQRELGGDEGGAAWVYHRVMDEPARLKFDGWLVQTGDELAYSASTPEWRFRTRVRRMVEMERKRKAGLL
jgi:hypothetical protein